MYKYFISVHYAILLLFDMLYYISIMIFKPPTEKNVRGFTLLELLVVMAIIGVLVAIAMVALDQSRAKGRDGARKTQVSEILNALELFYTDGNGYPEDGTPGNASTGAVLSSIGSGFFGSEYFSRAPDEANTRYFYCVSGDRKSMLLAIDTEQDRGGSNFCSILRGPSTDHGCNAWQAANATSPCSSRF